MHQLGHWAMQEESFDFLPGCSNLDRPKWSNWFRRYPRVPRNPFSSDGPNNANNKQNFANIFNGSRQQGCNAALPFPKLMQIASSCRSSLKFRKIFHGNDRNNHRNQLHWGGEFNDIELCRHVRPVSMSVVGVRKRPVMDFPFLRSLTFKAAGWTAASSAYGILEAIS